MAMIAITTNSSINVKPGRVLDAEVSSDTGLELFIRSSDHPISMAAAAGSGEQS
jgi:hypothetical protein